MNTPIVNNAGVQYVRDHLRHFPRPDRIAADAIKAWAAQHQLILDPDQVDVVTLHYQSGSNASWEGIVVQKQSLTQAMLSNWQGESNNNLVGGLFGEPWAGHFPGKIRLVEKLREREWYSNGAAYEVYNGLFRRSQPQEYSHKTHIDVPAEDLQRFIWNLDFHTRYKALLDSYWSNHLDSYRVSAQINFLAACNKQAEEGSLSRAGVRLAWQAAGVTTRPPSVQVRPLNVYGYTATDLLCFKDKSSGLTLLYIPGNASPLHEFASEGLLKDWFAQQCKDLQKRQALMEHFAQADTPDGLSYSGLATALDGLAVYPRSNDLNPQRPGFTTEGHWSPRDYVNYKAETYSPAIDGDLFLALAKRHKRRSYQDADFIVTDQSEVLKARWRGYLKSALDYLAPLALVVPELAPLFAIGGMAQFGLGLDQAIHGKNQAQQAEGVQGAAFGLLNAAPLLHQLAQESPLLLSFKDERFVMPSRVNGQLGYPMGPVTPPHFPEAIAEYFHSPVPIAPLTDADPLVSSRVSRIPRYDGTPDSLYATVDGYVTEMIYDVEFDAFIREDELNHVDPTFHVPDPAANRLIEIDVRTRPVTQDMRTRSLRALGINLRLPIEYPTIDSTALQPIPKQVSSIWVGDKVISRALLENLGNNARRLSESQYAYRLFLSNATPEAYRQNLRLLAEHAPTLQVVTLEEHPFYASFQSSPYFAQYQAAIDGNGGVATNFSSASDVLRYPLLNHEGGLYLDVDDTLRAPGRPLMINGQPRGEPGEAIDTVELLAPGDGLVLYPPVSNEKLGMHLQYNTTPIGSHPGNPLLETISEEMRTRFAAEPGFYDSRPDPQLDPQAAYEYAEKLNRLTGPAMLTSVIDRHLPLQATLRQVTNLYAMPRVNAGHFVDVQRFNQLQRQWLPLGRIVRIGGSHSWATT
ncbi:dermonecrotic toxin domain-containing protein [Pseudomonas sichuanensis]|uniref:dermonecrotic toxin domain-containing protein n=1 Tax=Pseudomonas sichuanensis TaxID=2213015 RepID=UPI0036EEB805